MKKRILAVLLAGLMATSLASCGGGTDSSSTGEDSNTGDSSVTENSSETTDKGELVALRALCMPANASGVIEGWWAEEVKREVGITIELLPTGDQGEQKLQALMASGELPDLVVFKDYKQVANAVAGNMLLAYDDYKDKLPNLYKNAGASLEYMADNITDDTGKVYTVGNDIRTNDILSGHSNMAPMIRYDLYKKIGSPKIETSYDYLDVLKQMQEANPTNADGQKVYGFSMWKDWDRSYMTLAMFAADQKGVIIPGEGSLAEINYNEGGKIKALTDEDSFYMDFLKYYFDANQMGLVDPDSMTQRFDDSIGKTEAGRVLLQYDQWGTGRTVEEENQGIGFRRVPADNEIPVQASQQPTGGSWTMAVGKSTKNPDKAMEFVDWYFSEKGAMISSNGPQGLTWDVDADNKAYVTEEGYKIYSDETIMLPGGKSWAKGGSGLTFAAYHGGQMMKEYNVPLGTGEWDKPDYAPEDTKLEKEWKEVYGDKGIVGYLKAKENGLTVAPFSPRPTFTDEMEQISARVGEAIKTISWKMIFAKDETEFNKLKAEMVDKAEGMGIQTFTKWYTEEYAKSTEAAAKYVK